MFNFGSPAPQLIQIRSDEAVRELRRKIKAAIPYAASCMHIHHAP